MKHAMTCAAAAALLATAAVAAPQARFSFEAGPGRLPKNVVPTDYTIAVVPDIAAGTLAGTQSVRLLVRAPTRTIVFNSLNETLTDVRLDGEPVSAVQSNDHEQLTTVTAPRALPTGRHTLSFSYTARIETQPHGLFLQSFDKPDGSRAQLLSTKMESTDARRMFPCWDEPAFRATFGLTVTVAADWATVSNMPVARRVVHGALATTTFERSPKMPSYLIEFTAGDLAELHAQAGRTRLGVWAVRGREQDGRVALENARQILADYNEYFGVPYPLPKLDSLAIPGGFTGAMENWGAITYNDQLLLLGPSSTLTDRQHVYSVQAHEMAHQWNGDLVTMGWWDDLWLNESFASWRGDKETELRNPSWKWGERQDESKEQAMRGDARLASHPIHQAVADELEAANAFDEITYDKGRAVLRMLEAFLGPEVFRDGLRRYIRARAFSNATASDLWDGLSAASGIDVAAVAGEWTEQPGFPLVHVAASCDAQRRRTIRLTATRFLLQDESPAAAAGHWSVPLRIRAGAAGTPQPVLLKRERQQLPAGGCDEALSVNADAVGFFRVQYDAATLAANTREFPNLTEADKIALLDDEWALVLRGDAPLGAFLALATAMGADLDARAWEQIAVALGRIEYAARGSPAHEAFAHLARSIIKPAATRLGWDARADATPDVQELRRTLLQDLGAWGDPEVLAEARRRFAAFIADRRAISPDDQEFILSTVALAADAATFERLHELARVEKDETVQRRYYRALMHVRDAQLAQRAAQIALSEEIPPQAAGLRLRLVVGLAGEHAALAWSTFTANADVLLAPYPKYAPLITSQEVPEVFWDGAPPQQLESWVRSRVPEQMSVNVQRGMESAHVLLLEKQLLVRGAEEHLKAPPPPAASP